MGMIYRGPVIFRSLVENLYSKINKRYTRKDPRIIVATPLVCHPSGFLVEYKCSLDKYFSELDKLIGIILSDKPQEYREKAVEELEKLSFKGINATAGSYLLYKDTLFLNPMLLLLFKLGINEEPFNLWKVFKHELIHHDFGDCDIYKNFRKLYDDRLRLP